MKRILFLLLLIPALCSGQTVLKIGTAGFVTVDGQNYARRLCNTYYGTTLAGDSTVQLFLPTFGYVSGQKCNRYLDGDNSNTAFASMAALKTWLNTNFEPAQDTITCSGSSGADTATAGTGLTGGKAAHSNTISMPATGTAGTYGGATAIPIITTDAQGRVTSVTTVTPVPANPILYVRIPLTSAQLLSLNTTPVTLIATPGSGKFIVPISIVFDYTFNTTAYSVPSTIAFQLGGTTYTAISNSVLTSGSSLASQIGWSSSGSTAVAKVTLTEGALTITAVAGNPTLGDGTAVATVYYEVMTR